MVYVALIAEFAVIVTVAVELGLKRTIVGKVGVVLPLI